MKLRKAQRQQVKLRIGLSGPSGSGKTLSALLMAYGICGSWDKIAVIDTERGSAELYSDLGEYNVLPLTSPFSPERYIEAIRTCEQAQMEIIIIDSVSHEWDGEGGCLESNDKKSAAVFGGNKWSAWSDTTARHNRFLAAIVQSPVHVIVTARSKVETAQEDVNGKKRVVKLGMKDIQREGFDYELTIWFNVERDRHLAFATKDRTGIFADRDPFVISHETGAELMAWNKAATIIGNPDGSTQPIDGGTLYQWASSHEGLVPSNEPCLIFPDGSTQPIENGILGRWVDAWRGNDVAPDTPGFDAALTAAIEIYKDRPKAMAIIDDLSAELIK